MALTRTHLQILSRRLYDERDDTIAAATTNFDSPAESIQAVATLAVAAQLVDVADQLERIANALQVRRDLSPADVAEDGAGR